MLAMSQRRKAIRIDDNTYVEVVSEGYNKVVRRYELTCVVRHVGRRTPSRKELREIFSKQYGKPVENVYIRSIRTGYGVSNSLIKVNLYDDGGRAEAFEPKHVVRRHSS